MNYMDLL